MIDKNQAHAHLQLVLGRGVQKGQAVVERLEREIPTDFVANTRVMRVEATEGVTTLDLVLAETALQERERFFLHQNALNQLASRQGIPAKYVGELQTGDWGRSLLAHILNTHDMHEPKRVLVRSVTDTARAVLSDRYRRFDARPIVQAALIRATNLGAVPSDGYASDLNMELRFTWPEVLWIGEDPVIMGAYIRTSDFGAGSYQYGSMVERLLCLNGMRGASDLRKVHLGGRLDDNIVYSQRTYQLDTETMASATGDLVGHSFDPATISTMKGRIERSADTKVEGIKTIEGLKKALTKAEIEKAKEIYNSDDVTVVPPGHNVWRLSNTFASLAKNAQTLERRLQLESMAGAMLEPKFGESPVSEKNLLDRILEETAA